VADYRFKNDTTADTTGIVRTADGAVIPNNTELGAWRDYLAWKAVPNTPDAASVTTSLATYRLNAKQTVDAAAELEYRKSTLVQLSSGPNCAAAWFMLIDEAKAMEADGAPSSTAYPLCQQLDTTIFGATLANRGAAVRTMWSGVRTRIGNVTNVRLKGHNDVDAAGSKSAVDAVLAAITWPA
jgi:hypothetical protein